MASVESISWVVVGLVFAVVLIALSSNLSVQIQQQEEVVRSEEGLTRLVRDCWLRETVQDCYIVDIEANISDPVAGVPVEWKSLSGKVKISREANKVIVEPF